MSKIVATYIRTGNDTFLRNQAKRIQEYCEEKGYAIADSVNVVGNCDLGFQMLMKMLAGAKEKGIDTVVMDSTNRIGRSVVEIIEVLSKIKNAGFAIETLDGSHEMMGALGVLAAMSAVEQPSELTLEENVELVFGYDVSDAGLEVNEAEAEVVKFIFERTQEFSANPPEDLVKEVIDEYHDLGKEISAEEAAEKVSYSAIMLRVEREVKEQWPEQYDAMLRKQNHNRNLASKITSSSKHEISASSMEPIVDMETWKAAQDHIKEALDDGGLQMDGMSI